MTKVHEEKVVYEGSVPKRVVTTTNVSNSHLNAHHHADQTTVALYKIYQFIWLILGIIETLLGFRVILKLMAANPVSPFTAFIYDISYPFAYPFLGMVSSPVAPNGFVFEWSTIIGMLVYAAVAYLLVYALQLIKPASAEEAEEVLEHV